ncbi:hypothetical protein [Streptomyces sp. NPDC048142]|uniref:hypothetical protein n=1 Tax=Streptomyces sp. NPDC048142 TaxID=3365501 RepID=UPI00372041E2
MTYRTAGDRRRRQGLADATAGLPPRLLPWARDGKSCYLSTDGGPNSALSRLADEMEAVQLGMGANVLESADRVLSDPKSPHSEVRYTALRLSECLRDALRVAESSGDRIPESEYEEPEDGPTLPAEAFE